MKPINVLTLLVTMSMVGPFQLIIKKRLKEVVPSQKQVNLNDTLPFLLKCYLYIGLDKGFSLMIKMSNENV